MPPVQIGEVMRGAVISRVLASRSSRAEEGNVVISFAGWREVAVVNEALFEPPFVLPNNAKATDLLGVFGPTGLTAYFGLDRIGNVKPGDTVVVSGAAGATGSVVGQIAKIKGARVIGIAGSEDKVRWLTSELGFDAALNYKDADFHAKFKEATPDLIDVYWDNGGARLGFLSIGGTERRLPWASWRRDTRYGPRESQQVRQVRHVWWH